MLSAQQRDHRIDLVRGILLILMTLNHFRGWWAKYTWQPLGFFSAAEGFVLLSAIMAGVIYGRPSMSNKSRYLRPIYRSVTLYKYHIATAVFIGLVALAIPMYGENWLRWLRPMHLDTWRVFMMEVILIQQPKHLDIIPMYAAFMLLLPVLLWLSRSKLYFIVLLGSLLCWYINPYIELRRFAIMNICGDCQYSYFNWLTWQFLWVVGVGFGIAITKQNSLLRFLKKPTTSALILLILILLFSIKAQWIDYGIINKENIDRANLGWLRLINLFCFGVFLYSISSYIGKNLKLRFVNLLGRNSLQVFSLHVILLYLLKPLNEELMVRSSAVLSTLLVVLVVGVLVSAAWIYEKSTQRS
jgi:hypothetical protein